MKVGGEILHPDFGRGSVVEICPRGGKAGAIINFGYMTDWVPADALAQDGSAEIPPPPPEPPWIGTLNPPDDVVEARRGVLALRLGQILERDVRELSAGTADAEADMRALVSQATQGRTGFLLVEGAWGSGKTHLLTMLNAIAASEDMASCGAILDGSGLRLSDPMKLMAALLSSLRYPWDPAPQGIRDKLALFRENSSRPDGSATLIDQAMHGLSLGPRSAMEDADAAEIVEDYFALALPAGAAKAKLSDLGYRRVKLPSMNARNVGERPERFCQLLRGWTEFVVKTGAKGLVLTFDELDVEYASTMGGAAARRQERERRAALLSALARMGSGRLGSPLIVAFGSAPGSGDGPGEDDPVCDLKKHLGRAGLKAIGAPQPDLAQMESIGRRVLELYTRAYPEWSAAVARKQVERRLDALARTHLDELAPVTRNFVRQTLELLDVAPDICGRPTKARTETFSPNR